MAGLDRDLSLCVINTYFAPLPAYARLYLDTCRHNPEVRFLFISDQARPSELPPNVTWLRMTLGELADRLQSALGFRVGLTASLKVCDVRPAFGLAFASALRGFTHWAYSDIDLLWGRILPLLRPHVGSADVLSFRERCLSATFTVFRNTPENARLFLRAPDIEDTLGSTAYHDFDESCSRWDRPRSFSELWRGGMRTSLWDVLAEGHAVGDLRWVHPELLAEPDPRRKAFAFRWDDGVLTDAATGEERIAYHLLGAKDAPFFSVPSWRSMPRSVQITEAGIADARGGLRSAAFHARRLGVGVPRYAAGVSGRAWRRLQRETASWRRGPASLGRAVLSPRHPRDAPWDGLRSV